MQFQGRVWLFHGENKKRRSGEENENPRNLKVSENRFFSILHRSRENEVREHMYSTSVYDLEFLGLEGTERNALATDQRVFVGEESHQYTFKI